MSPKYQTIYSTGIHHGLPTFPDHDGKKYTAIVTGANGISGSEIVNALVAAPERWETIYAMSRRPPRAVSDRVKTIAADFKDSTPEQLAKLFKSEGVKADYIFFTSYIQPPTQEGEGLWANHDELETVNVTLLSNFLEALTISSIIPKRFLLQTGGKHYAVHLGPTAIPMTEDTPDRRVPHPNFYFPQEDILSDWCEKHSTHWTVTRPGFIIGANPTAPINISYGLAIYASVQKELGKRLGFPADIGAWDINKDLSTASLIGYFSEWAVLTEEARNQAFNVVDDSPFSYGKFWPELAGWYGIEYDLPEQDEAKYNLVRMPRNPPPRGFGTPGVLKVKFSFEEWARSESIKETWEKIQEREGLTKELNPWKDKETLFNVFATLDAELLGGWARTQTMDKAKKMGWHGHVQTNEGMKLTIEKMIEMKMVPAV
ncbi:uncharacterized protein LY89DRAFT_706108 [Mollisia scopiformis]|uniref:PRISE-like Rossmann-fold domain-containing protein n=1 Tax=Mollisia scopiformis TaxID=149040 RepID=A0A194XGN3_MOLSC|nr:uncharacterized protein LY89DRAFT_706108 [Mollisia scopiformis]KUJ19294.1 hypothetical protein LY89DRAFT_706108 [Mollisia scopiformis]